MPDIAHQFGNDLTLSPTGDLATSDGTQLGQERVLRRLLTNPQEYLWHLEYGAGLPGFVGQPANIARIRAVTRTQMYRESVVARTPASQISVKVNANGTVTMNIIYADAPTQQNVTLTFNLAA